MKRKLVNLCAILFTLCASLFTGCTCDFSILDLGTLSTPSIVSYVDYDTITWKTVKNAKSYNVYCDGVLIDTVVDEYEEDVLIYEIGKYVNDDKEHSVYITASAGSSFVADSSKSNSITYKNNHIVRMPNFEEYTYDLRSGINFTLNGSEISYSKIEGIESYYLFMYSNFSNVRRYKLDGQTISLKSTGLELDKKNEITYLRLGYVINDKNYLLSNELYYNPDNIYGYTDNIVLFDGYIYDHYIESLQELNTVVYYNFINRIEDFNIKLDNAMKGFVLNAFSGKDLTSKVNNAMYYSFMHILETSEIMTYSNNGFVTALNGEYEFNIKVDFDGNGKDYGSGECNVNLRPLITRSEDNCVGYYDTVDYIKRKDVYGITGGDFASDKQLLQMYVESTEELYWAVENKVTPRFKDNTSRGYVVYNKAKEVINEIISDDMTDYEKALSLFDWICINSVYDYSTYTSHVSTQPCYYLEGVFITGYAVCDGYSKAYSLMCNMLGIDCIRITGEAVAGGEKGGHAWNKISLDVDPENNNGKECYLVDITWTEIQTSDVSEILSRMYFLLSDSDVEGTHYPYMYRTEFSLYESPVRYDYYLNTKFNYNSSLQDFVISSDNEFKEFFGYLRDSGVKCVEILVDYDYMVDIYELRKQKTYDPRVDYKVNKDAYGNAYGITYHVELLEMLKIKMKECKVSDYFDLQFLSYITSDDCIPYGDGKSGFVLVMEQYLLIDEVTKKNNEVDNLLKYLDTNNLVGNQYYLYIRTDILNDVSAPFFSEVVDRAVILFNNSSYVCENIKIEIELVYNSHIYQDNSYGCLFIIEVLEK